MPLGEEDLLRLPEGKAESSSETGGFVLATNVPAGSDSSDPTTQDGSSAPEIGVSWIYKLKKDELTQELLKFRLDPTGTVDEKRKRLVMFMRVGHASPQPQRAPSPFAFPPQTSTVVPNISTPTVAAPVQTVITAPSSAAPNTLDPLTVRKWNIHFNGKGDPAAFLERLDEICAYSNFNPAQLLPVLPELLQGEPLLWHRNNRRYWRNWADFLRDFRTLYFPVNYLEDLEAEIGRRLQKVNESVNTYLTDLQTLIRRHGQMSPEQEVRWLYRNMLPDYRLNVKTTDFTDVPTLTARMKEFEVLRDEVQTMYSKPKHQTVTVSRLPGSTATSPNSANLGTQPTQAARLQVPATQVGSQRPSTEPASPSATRLPPRTGNQRNAPPSRTTSSRPNICWRCGESGHYRSQCTGRLKLFCSRCGREGTMTKDCNCRQPEN